MNHPSSHAIAIVDDDPHIQVTLSDILTTKGYRPIVYQSGREALAQLVREEVAVALLDLKLSDLSGLEILRGIKQLSPDTECILLTGYASQASAIEAVNAGVYAYLQKPYDIEHLLTTVQRAIEKRGTNKALRENAEHYRLLIDHSPNAIAVHQDGKVVFVNRAALSLMGAQSEDELLGKPIQSIVHPDHWEAARQRIQRMLQGEAGLYPTEDRYVRLDGSEVAVQVFAAPFTYRGQPAVQVIVQDITERKGAEATMRLQSAALEASANTIVITDQQAVIQWANPAFTALTGYDLEEAVGKNPRDLVKSGVQGPEFYQALWDTILSGKVWHGTLVNRRKDGTLYDEEMTITPVLGSDSQPQYFIAIKEDITERKRAEETLRLEKEKLSTMAETVPGLLFSFRLRPGGSSCLPYASPAIEALFGLKPSEVLEDATPIYARIHPEDLKRVQPSIVASARTLTPWHAIFRYQHPAKGEIWVEGNSMPLREEGGSIIWHGFANDITERKRSEATLTRRAAQLSILNEIARSVTAELDVQAVLERAANMVQSNFNYHHVGLYLHDPSTNQLHLRAKAGAYVGLFAADHRLKTDEGITGWVYRHRQSLLANDVSVESHYVNLYPGIVPTQAELGIPIQSDEHIYGVLDVQSPSRNAFDENDVLALETLGRQIATAIENAQLYQDAKNRLDELNAVGRISAELRLARNRSEMLPIILRHLQGLLQASGAAYAYRDENSGEIVYESGVDTLAACNHRRMPAGSSIVDEALATGSPYFGEVGAEETDFISPDCPIPAGQGVILAPLNTRAGVIGTLILTGPTKLTPTQTNLLKSIADIAANAIQRATLYEETVRHAAELEQRVEERTAELRRVNQELERAARLKDEFLASMSHELRTPLTGVLNLSEALQDQVYGPLNERQMATLSVIEESGRHLLSLINDILDLSKIEAGQLDLQMDTISANDICQASLQMVKGLVQKKNQHLAYTIEPSIITLQADPRRLKQMLVNLLSNAIKFTPPEGQIGLDVRADPQTEQVRFAIWDTGIGIDPEDLPRLFQPFTQLDSGLSRQYSGTGLGLTLVKRMADLHGGGIHVESQPGQGSRFTIVLPRREGQSSLNEQPGIPAEAVTSPLENDTASGTRRATILIADDNEVNVTAYRDYLTSKGYGVWVANDVPEAIAIAEEEQPAVILMDIHMPSLDGLAAIRTLRGHHNPQVARIPIIAVTALAMSGDRERCLQAGANDYLSKPVRLRELLQAIERQLR